MKHRAKVSTAVCCLVLLLLVSSPAAGGPRAKGKAPLFGAKGDGVTKDTAAIQKAIDACAERGGGTVRFPAGTYLCGSLRLRSGVTLHLEAGATIKASKDNDDFDPYEKLDFKNDADHETSFFHYALIWGEDVENIGILGPGTIDSNGEKRGGPKSIALKRCKQALIKDLRILNAPNYAISMLGTDNVNIDGVTILNSYCDGIDPDSCRNVRIANCHIESNNDAIVPKTSFSLGERRSMENLTVTNCLLATDRNAFKLGTESGGDFKRIAVSNCVVFRLPGTGKGLATSGISLETVDGANIDGVVISNITMVGIEAPIFLRLGNRGRDMATPTPGTLRNVVISNIVATGATTTSSITGIPGHPVEGVTLSDIRLAYMGGAAKAHATAEVPELIPNYPSADMFKTLPAYALYCRHVDGLQVSNVTVSYENPDARPAVIFDDVSRLDLNGFSAKAPGQDAPVLRLVNTRDTLIRGCAAPSDTGVYLRAEGSATRAISLIANDLSRAKKPISRGDEVAQKEIVSIANQEGPGK